MSSHKIRFWAITALCRETGGDITAVGAYAGQACRQTTLHYIRRAQDEAVQKAAARKVFGQYTCSTLPSMKKAFKTNKNVDFKGFLDMGWTGLEPVTSRV